jgi:hypothetical protein
MRDAKFEGIESLPQRFSVLEANADDVKAFIAKALSKN